VPAQRLRTALARIPDGEASAENFLDGDAVVERPIRVALRVIKEGVRRPIRSVLPSGTVVNPVSPAPVNSYIPSVRWPIRVSVSAR
jgi:N-methylhydantoinase B/oxoprolinase/acetone carboxylase alpha subunit